MAIVLVGMVLTAPARAELRNENLLVPLPQGFKLGWRSPDGHMQEFVQPPETVDTWSRLITIQTFRGVRNADPEAFAGRVASGWISHCPNASAGKVLGGTERGYAVAVWFYACPLNLATRKPETMWLKAISGADGLYVAQYAVRAAANKDIIITAMAFLRQIGACDTRRADRPCQPAMR